MTDNETESSIREDRDLANAKEIIVCEGVSKWFGDFQALNNVSATIKEQEVVVVLGPSGSGKSTWIRCINRLEQHQEGRIMVDGVELSNDLRNIEKVRSEVGMVFQMFNLFPHLTVRDNISLAPIWVRKKPRAEAEEQASSLLERVGIPGVIVGMLLTTGFFLLVDQVLGMGLSWQMILLIAAMIAATDPISVVALFKEFSVSKRLGIIVEGESLINDGVAVVLFGGFIVKIKRSSYLFYNTII